MTHLKTLYEDLFCPYGHDAMMEERNALDSHNTWELVNSLVGKKDIEYKWVYLVKVNSNGLDLAQIYICFFNNIYYVN